MLSIYSSSRLQRGRLQCLVRTYYSCGEHDNIINSLSFFGPCIGRAFRWRVHYIAKTWKRRSWSACRNYIISVSIYLQTHYIIMLSITTQWRRDTNWHVNEHTIVYTPGFKIYLVKIYGIHNSISIIIIALLLLLLFWSTWYNFSSAWCLGGWEIVGWHMFSWKLYYQPSIWIFVVVVLLLIIIIKYKCIIIITIITT